MSIFSLFLKKIAKGLIFLTFISARADAAGIVLGETRIVYSSDQQQVSIPVRNSSNHTRYMVQSWVEDAQGKKSGDFIVTPPVYVSNAKDENIMRITYVGKNIHSDVERIYYFNAKAIPAVDKKQKNGENQLILASVTRIKLFVRPTGLPSNVKDAPESLSFKRSGRNVIITNSSPYFVTLVNIKAGNEKHKSVMVPPKGNTEISMPNISSISYQTINDYGGITPVIRKNVH